MIFTTNIHGVEVDVEYTYCPPVRGARDTFCGIAGAGIQLEPDEPEGFIVDNVTTKYGEELLDILAPRILQQLEIEAKADYYDQKEDCYE